MRLSPFAFNPPSPPCGPPPRRRERKVNEGNGRQKKFAVGGRPASAEQNVQISGPGSSRRITAQREFRPTIEGNSAALKSRRGLRPAAQNVQTPGLAERGERLGEGFLLSETGRPLISRPVPGGKDKERGSGLSRTNPSPHPSPRFAGRGGKVRGQIQRVLLNPSRTKPQIN